MNRAILFFANMILTAVVVVRPVAAKETHPFGIHDMLAMERIADHQVSPDGKRVVFVVRETDLEANKGRTDIYLADVKPGTEPATGKAGLRRLTTHPDADVNPRWLPDGQSILFLSTRGGSMQVWRMPVDGGEAVQITDEPLDVGNLIVSPTGTHIAYSMEVFPGASVKETKDKLDEDAKRKSTGRVYDKLFIRHWDTWKDGRRSHVFVRALADSEVRDVDSQSRDRVFQSRDREGAGSYDSQKNPLADARGSERPHASIDVMKDMDADSPTKPFGGPEEIAFTPDGKSIVFAARDVGREEAWSTDVDLYVAPIDASAKPRCITEDNQAVDTTPVFSPDGKKLAYLAMKRAGYEADRMRIMLMDWPGGQKRTLTELWDRSPSELCWSSDGNTLFATADNVGQHSLFAVDVEEGKDRVIVWDGSIHGPQVVRQGKSSTGNRIIYSMHHLRGPAELYCVKPDGTGIERITRINDEKVAAARMGEVEQFSFSGWNGEKVFAYLVKPVDFDESKKYPVAFLIHGGPQGSFGNDFHYRWNPQAYAGAGYAAIMVDFHGSTGYGQTFCDSIRGDWGGKPLEDLQKGLEAALAKYPWMNGDRVAALGASYGGYMINWIAGRWPDRFRCLVCHDGNIDEQMAYFDTEELWFPEWEHGGPPWENPAGYQKHNPIALVKEWKTPMLVIHGALDYRVVDTQGMSTFTALQRKGIPSKFLHFPDENHWVLKPANSILWHETVIGWLDQWTKK